LAFLRAGTRNKDRTMAFEERPHVLRVQARSLKRGATLSLAGWDDACLKAIYGEGGGCVLEVAAGAAGVWIPLRGSLQVHSTGLSRPVHSGEALITEHDHRVKAIGHANGRWLAMLGGRRVWERLLTDALAPDTQLFTEVHKADRELRRSAVAVVRAALPVELEAAIHAVVEKVVALQVPLQQAIARCPGRTTAKRRQAFLRLQRVRHFISICCDSGIDNAALASMANYSPCHFLRIFNLVYGETPHEYLVSQRLQRARHLLRSSDLAITEVASASGFENRSAFSRLFRQRFGTTARELKRQFNAIARADTSRAAGPLGSSDTAVNPAIHLKSAYSSRPC
jgi:AraC family transcriptional regulator